MSLEKFNKFKKVFDKNNSTRKKRQLEKIIKEDFNEFVSKNESVLKILKKAKILETNVTYLKDVGKFLIEITKIKLPGGEVREYNREYCLTGVHNHYTVYLYDPENNQVPAISKFKKDYFLYLIKGAV